MNPLQQLQQQMQQQQEMYAQLEARLRNMSTPPIPQPVQPMMQPAPPPPPPAMPEQTPNDAASPFIEVKSRDEARNYKIEQWRLTSMGETFLFYNADAGEFYYKWHNFDTAKTMFETFKKVPDGDIEVNNRPIIPPEIMGYVAGMAEKIEHMEGQINRLVELAEKRPRGSNGKFMKSETEGNEND